MIVLRSTHDRLQRQYIDLATRYAELVNEWNDLVTKINARGGLSSLNVTSSQLTKNDIRRLLQLCHPDRHPGKRSAEEMTQKLLKLKEGMS